MEAQNDHILKIFFFPRPKESASLASASLTNVAVFHRELCARVSSLYSRQKARNFLLLIELEHNANLEC